MKSSLISFYKALFWVHTNITMFYFYQSQNEIVEKHSSLRINGEKFKACLRDLAISCIQKRIESA